MPVQVDAASYGDVLAVRMLPSRIAAATRPAYHIALLLDTSGSMEGEPLEAVIRTLHLLIDGMADYDCLTIIQYANSGTILAHAVQIERAARDHLHTVVEGLTAEGGTNMEAAFETLGMVALTLSIDAVFLMTDGYVNIGNTSSVGLLRILSSQIPAGTPVNTLGYGAKHNSEMLRDMALRSRGSYTYADSTELIPAIIGNIVSGLADQVGFNAILTASIGGICVEIGADREHPEVYRVGPLIADKTQWVLFRGTGSPVQLTWREDGRDCSAVVAAGTGVLNPLEIEEQVQRVRLATIMTTVSGLVAHRNYEGAIGELLQCGHRLAMSPAVGRPFITRLQAQVDEMLEDVRCQQESLVPDQDVAMLTRMVSNTTALGTQHGFFLSRNTTVEDPNVTSPFSTPHQRTASAAMTQGFQSAM